MLYMEDYLEMIEHLPQDLKDRFTEIRELDLQVQNTTEKLDDRVKAFFSNAKKMRVSERDTEYENIRNEYYKVLEDADEKVHQSNQLYDLVDRYLRRLDQELHKFKMELEADNAGITEVLEKRSLALDEPPPQPKLKQKDRERGNGHPSSQKENRLITAGVLVKSEKKGERKVSVEKTPVNNAQIAGSSTTPVLSYNTIGHTVPGGHALVAAASQAIAATQQLQQGRRTAGLNKSTYFDGINSSVIPAELNFLNNAEFHQAAQQALAATTGTSSSTVDQKRNKRKSLYSQNQEVTPPPQDEVIEEATIEDAPETPEWNSDPSEPRYCICNQVSYGDMVACDNANCPIEWFHYPCVGIVSTPKGKWYCSSCSATVKRRGRR